MKRPQRPAAVMALLAIAAAPSWLGAQARADAPPRADAPVHADATAPAVILLRPATPDEVTTEAMARVHGELKAAGFEVAVVPLRGDDTRGELESAGRDRHAVAAFALFVRPTEGGASVAEIWVSDRIRQKIVIQNAVLHDTDRGRGAEILAVRAVELLKASLVDFWTPASPAPTMQPDPAPAPMPPAHEVAPEHVASFAAGLGAGLGVGVIETFGAMGMSWSPDATVSYGWPSGWSARATFAGLGPSVMLTASAGAARIERQLALLEAVKAWWPRAALVPFVTAGAGAEHVRVVGSGNPPYQGHTSDDVSLSIAAGAGLALRVVSSISLVAQARGLAAWPWTVVQVAGTEVGRIGVPALLVNGGLFGTLP
jgi:hypothetical protein